MPEKFTSVPYVICLMFFNSQRCVIIDVFSVLVCEMEETACSLHFAITNR